MHPRLSLSVLAAVVLGLGAPSAAEACQCGGTPPQVSEPTSTAAPGFLAVRPAGARGPLVAYELTSGRMRFALPAGIASADGRRYVVATRRHLVTTLWIYDLRAGRGLGGRVVRGGWNLGAVSGNGRWVGLVRPARGATQVRLFDLRRRERQTFSLKGWFDIDAVANDGRRVFLIQYVKAGYLIRFFDLGRRRLAARVLTEGGEPMAGTAWGAVASPDGRRLMTLYLRGDRAAEVHTLDLARGTAVCIDLPRGNAGALRSYTLALGADRRTLYAANAALGLVATIDLARLRVVRVVRFPMRTSGEPASRAAAVSHDGRTMYFAAGRNIYAYDAAYRTVRGAYDAGAAAAALAFTPDDRTLRVVRRDGRALRLDAATGTRR
jgi:hypothetical protein